MIYFFFHQLIAPNIHIMAVSRRFDSIKTALLGSTDNDEKAIAALETPNDAIALLVHAWALENDLKLTAVGDNKTESSSKLEAKINELNLFHVANYAKVSYNTHGKPMDRIFTVSSTKMRIHLKP